MLTTVLTPVHDEEIVLLIQENWRAPMYVSICMDGEVKCVASGRPKILPVGGLTLRLYPLSYRFSIVSLRASGVPAVAHILCR